MLIQDEYDLNIYVDKLNIFEAPGVIFLGATILESISSPIPGCQLKLSIPLGWLDERSIIDGTVLRFEIKNKNLNMQENLQFRLCNIENIEINQKFVTVDLQGLLDFYEGYTYSNAFNI